MSYPLVSIITVNYKQPSVTCELLDSIRQFMHPNLEVIVVDNEQLSNDSTLFNLHYPGVIVINSKENLGFAGGNNIGIKAATGDYLFFINNDTILKRSTIDALILALGDPKIGAVSPVICYHENPEVIQFAGFTKLNSFTGRNRTLRQKPQYTGLIETAYIHGAAVMLRRDVIEQCGLMPEDYFLYYEEFAWSENIKRAGYQLKVSMDSSILHKESISTGKNSPLKTYYQTRNRMLFMSRYNQKVERFVFRLFFTSVSLPIHFIKYKINKQAKNGSALLKAFRDASISKAGMMV